MAGVIRSAVLKTEQGNITVFLAPDWYLAEQKVSLKAGDELEVTGSKVTLGQQPAIIVKDLKVGGKSITLRNDRGYPVWMEKPPARRAARRSDPAPALPRPRRSGACGTPVIYEKPVGRASGPAVAISS